MSAVCDRCFRGTILYHLYWLQLGTGVSIKRHVAHWQQWFGLALGAIWVGAGLPKVAGIGPAVRHRGRVGMSVEGMRLVGVAEASGGAGLSVGVLLFTPLAVLASVCLVVLMGGAVFMHITHGDRWYGPINAIVMGGLMAAMAVFLVR